MNLKLYATGSATANAVQSILIPSTLTIIQILAAIRFNSITDGGQVNLELSRASARQIATNEAQDSVAEFAFESNFLTSGLSQGGINVVLPCRERFQQGSRLYLHALVGGTIIYDATFTVYFG
jgi:hypothetical protein